MSTKAKTARKRRNSLRRHTAQLLAASTSEAALLKPCTALQRGERCEGSSLCCVFLGERPQHPLPPRALPLPQLSCSPVPAGTREWHQWPRRHQARAGRATYFLSPLYHSKTGAGTPAPSHRISPFPPSITPLDLSSWIVGATEKKIVK